MFDTSLLSPPVGDGFDTDWADRWRAEVDRLTKRVQDREAEVSRLRAEQVADLRRLEALDADFDDGSRTMIDWVKATLDVSPQTATRMMRVARAGQDDIEAQMRRGVYGVDRADLLCRIRALNGPEEIIERQAEHDLGHLYGLYDRLRHYDHIDEQLAFEDRFMVIKPDLEESGYRFWGHTTATDGRIVESALTQRADLLPVIANQNHGQRLVDALVSICLDSLTAIDDTKTGRPVIVAEVFVDAQRASGSEGAVGAALSTGPRVGPNTLSEVLCDGKVRVVYRDEDRLPLAASQQGETIPPAVRAHVLERDHGRCAITGCGSTHHLQIHHITERANHGNHDPDNLITLCWYHHHVAIHMLGMTLDQASPPHRRRLTPLYAHSPPAA